MGHCRGATTGPGQRVGKQRNAVAGGEGRQFGGVWRSRAGHDEQPSRGVRPGSLRGWRRGGWLAQYVGVSIRTRGRIVRELPVEDERLAQREVEMDRPGGTIDRRPVCAAGERADEAQRRGCRFVHAHLEEPLDGVAIQL